MARLEGDGGICQGGVAYWRESKRSTLDSKWHCHSHEWGYPGGLVLCLMKISRRHQWINKINLHVWWNGVSGVDEITGGEKKSYVFLFICDLLWGCISIFALVFLLSFLVILALGCVFRFFFFFLAFWLFKQCLDYYIWAGSTFSVPISLFLNDSEESKEEKMGQRVDL